MTSLMSKRGSEKCAAREQFDRRKRDAVGRTIVERMVAAHVDGCRQRVDKALRAIGQLVGRRHGADRAWIILRRQPVYLVAIEHGIGAQHTARLVGRLAGHDRFHGFVVGFVEDGDLRAFALADLAAKRLALLVRHPGARVIAGALGTQPQPEAVDALVGIPRRAERTATQPGAPRFHPGTHAGFELVDDGVGDDVGRRRFIGGLCHGKFS